MKDLFYEKKITCPVCKRVFQQRMVRESQCIVETRDSDFRVQYANANPSWYGVVVCPGCGYAATKATFSQLRPESINKVKPAIERFTPTDLTGERGAMDAVESYLRAARCLEALDGPYSTLGGLYLRAAWVYREMGEPDKERMLLEPALKAYITAFNRERDLKISTSDLAYLIGELNRRLHRYQEAISWFSQVVTMPEVRPSTKRLARDMWQLAREGYHSGDAQPEVKEEKGEQSEEEPVDDNPLVQKENQPVKKVSPRRAKAYVRIQLYHDQVYWLDKVGKWWGEKPDLESSALLRALLDLVEDVPLSQLGVSSEEELKKVLINHIIAKGGDD